MSKEKFNYIELIVYFAVVVVLKK